MASRKQQLLLDVKMMLDKASLASEAKEIEKLLSKQQMDIDFDSAEFENAVRQVVNKMSREAITVIGEGFNKALASIGKKQIKLENFLELPNDALWMELGKKAGKYFAQGINTTLQKSSPKTKDVKQNSPDAMLRDKFTNLTKQRDALTQRKDKLNNQIRIKNEAESKLRYYGTGSIMDTGGDFKRQAQQLFDDFMQWNNKIQEVEEGAHASGQALQAWVQAANAVSRLSNTIQSPKLGDVQKKRIIDAIGEKKFEYFSNGDFDEDVSIGADQIESFVDTDELQDKKDQIIKQIKQLDIEIDKLTQEHPELISEQSVIDAEDKIKRVEEAYERLKFGRGKHKGELDLEKIHDIELALNYKNGKSGLDALSDKMGNVRFANWEEQAKNALKFAQEYEKRLDNPALNQDELLRHKDTYEKIKPHLAEYRAMLQDVLNLTQGITPHIPDEIVQREEVVNEPTREASDIKAVENAVDKVTVAVNKKTEAFRTEGKVVSDVTQKEIGQLTALEQTLNSAVGVDDVGKLTDYVDNNYLSQGKHMSDFLNDIKNKSLEADAELKKILTSLHLIDENGDITFDIKQSGASGSGTTHNGALIGKDFAIIERSGYAKVANSNLPSATKTVNDAGINVAQILGYIKSKTTEGYFDVQKTVQGDNMFKDGVLSPEVVNATEEQLRQLVDAFIMARQNGFYIENGGSNIVYDAKKGFSFYDLEEMDSDDKDYFKNLNLDDLKLDALEDAISVFSEYNRDYTNAETDPLRGDFFAKFRAAISKHPGFAGINFSDKFDDIYAQHGDVDEQWDKVLKDKKQTLNNQDSSQQINDVTNAVRAKTQAFKEEQVEVDKVVNAEIEALIKLEQVVNRVRDALNKSVENVNILQSNADSIKIADKKDEGETKRVQNLTKLYEKLGEARFTAEHSSDPIERHKASKQKEKLEQILAKKNPTDKKTKERAEAEFQGEQKARIAEMKKLAKLQAEQSKIEAKNEVNGTNKTHEERLSYLQRIIAEQKKSLGLSEKEQNVLADIAAKTKMNAVSIETDKKAERDAKKADDDRKNKLQAKRNEVGLSKTENIAKQAATVKDQLSDLGLTQSTQAAEILNEELTQLYQRIQEINNVSTADGITDDMAKQLSTQTARVRQMTSQYKADVEQHLRLSGSNATVIGNGTPFVDSDVARDSLARQVKNFEDGKVKITGYNHELQQLTYEVRNNKNQITSCTVEYDRLSHQLVRLKGTTRQAEGFFQSIGRKAKEIGAYFSGSSLIYKAAETLREGVTYVKEIDAALTELKKVTNETTETYDEFLDTAGKTASKVGSTIKDITSSAADWARLGYSISEAAELAETTQVLMNVSEFTDVSTATDSLISSIQAFKYTAEESMDVVDILNTIGNNYAISTADLATSLTKSSGSLVAANGTLEEAVALTATANTIIQDADVVGTALKTVAMRLRGTSTEVMEAEGVDTDGVVTSKSKLRGKIQGLSGVDIFTQTGEYKSTYEILLEISKVWKDISDVDQAALLELIAGKRAGSVMSAILNNPQILADSFESANNAMGSAWKENETYLDSIQGKTDLLTNDLQTLWSHILDSDIIKGFIDFVRVLIQVIDKLGLFGTAFVVLTTNSMVKSKSLTQPFVDIIEILATGSTKLKFFGMDLKNLATSSKKPLDNLRKSLSGVLVKIQEMQASRVADDFNADKINIDQFGKLTNTKALSGQVITANRTSFIDALHKSKVKLPTEKDQDIASALSLNSSLKALTKTQVQATLATLGLDEAQQKAILSSLGFDVAAKGLTGTLGALWSVLWPMLAMAAIALVFAGIAKAIDNAVTTTKELEEELDNLSSKIEETQGKITELNSELETTQERIADLSSQSALTFTEQEELENLKLQNEELKRQLELQEALLKSQEAQRLTVAKDYVNQAWYGEDDAKYYIDSGYKVGEDTGWKGFWNDGVSATTALDHAIKGYEESKKNYDKYTEVLSKWNHEDEDSNKKLLTSHGIWENYNYEDIEAFQKTQEQLMDDASNSVNTILGDMSSAITEYGLSYSLGDADVNKFLDQYYAYFDKWQLAQGKSSKSSIIGNMFGTTGSAEAKELAKQFKEIAANEILSLDKQQEKIRKVIGRVNEENSAYNSLKTTMDEVGITAQEIAEYFTEGAGGVDLSNPDAVVAQYAEARRIMKELSALKDHPNLEQELSALGNGGSVDLINRKQIEVSKLEDAGWGDLEGDYATVFSSTFSNKEETIAINVTPILPNGSVLSPEELEEYANSLLAGADDIKKLQIGAQFEGEDAIEQASKAAAEISSLSELYYLSDDLFKKNKDGIFEAQVDAFSELLQGMDEECQKTFMSLAEQVKNGEIEWNQAINQFEIAGLIAGMQAVENQFDELNDITFSGVADEISGFINTTEELSAALEDVASSMDLVDKARDQMNSSGRVSIKTALELMQATDRWNEILTITNGTITLNANAEEVLVEAKLNVIKANIDEALTAAQLKVKQLEAAQATLTSAGAADVTDDAYVIYTNAMNSYTASIAAFGAAIDALVNKKGNVIGVFNETYKASMKTFTPQDAGDVSAQLKAAQEEVERLQAQKSMLAQGDTWQEYRDNYDYDKKPGDKYSDDKTKDAFQKAMDYWENRIGANQSRFEQIQNEIDLIEEKGKVAGDEYYKEQIKLENERLALLNKQKAAANSFLGSFKEGDDEWWNAANTLNDYLLVHMCRNTHNVSFELLGTP